LAIIVAATLTGVASSACAQMLGNVFAGSNGSNPTVVSTTSAVLSGSSNTAVIGPDFSTTVTLGLGVVDTLTATLNSSAAPGALTISETGVTGLLGNFSVGKTFTSVNLTASTPYQFVLTASQASQIALLSNLSLTITIAGVQVNSSSLFSLFNGGTNATVNFTTPAVLNPAGPLGITIAGTTTAALLGGAVTFSGATFDQVPEPKTWAFLAAGLGLLSSVQSIRRVGRR